MLKPGDNNSAGLSELWRHAPFGIHLAVHRNLITDLEAVLYCELEDLAVGEEREGRVPF